MVLFSTSGGLNYLNYTFVSECLSTLSLSSKYVAYTQSNELNVWGHKKLFIIIPSKCACRINILMRARRRHREVIFSGNWHPILWWLCDLIHYETPREMATAFLGHFLRVSSSQMSDYIVQCSCVTCSLFHVRILEKGRPIMTAISCCKSPSWFSRALRRDLLVITEVWGWVALSVCGWVYKIRP